MNHDEFKLKYGYGTKTSAIIRCAEDDEFEWLRKNILYWKTAKQVYGCIGYDKEGRALKLFDDLIKALQEGEQAKRQRRQNMRDLEFAPLLKEHTIVKLQTVVEALTTAYWTALDLPVSTLQWTTEQIEVWRSGHPPKFSLYDTASRRLLKYLYAFLLNFDDLDLRSVSELATHIVQYGSDELVYSTNHRIGSTVNLFDLVLYISLSGLGVEQAWTLHQCADGPQLTKLEYYLVHALVNSLRGKDE